MAVVVIAGVNMVVVVKVAVVVVVVSSVASHGGCSMGHHLLSEHTGLPGTVILAQYDVVGMRLVARLPIGLLRSFLHVTGVEGEEEAASRSGGRGGDGASRMFLLFRF